MYIIIIVIIITCILLLLYYYYIIIILLLLLSSSYIIIIIILLIIIINIIIITIIIIIIIIALYISYTDTICSFISRMYFTRFRGFCQAMQLVLFDEAMQHLMKINRNSCCRYHKQHICWIYGVYYHETSFFFVW